MNTVLADKPNIEIYGTITYTGLFKWTRIILFQLLASAIFTYGLMSSYFIPNTPNNVEIPNIGHSSFISLSLFLALVLSGQLTGGHTNPIITLTLFIGKTSVNLNWISTLVYILAQFAGSFIGAAIAYGVIPNYGVPEPGINFTPAQIFGGELVGSFLLCLWLLIVVNDKTTFIKANFWNYILLPIIFYIAREVTSEINGLNPASVLANQVFFGIKYNKWGPINNYWAYIVGPVLGSVIAALFFNFFYFPMLMRWKNRK